MRVIPSAAAITKMEECFDWLMLIDPEDARIVWLRGAACAGGRSASAPVSCDQTPGGAGRRRF